MKRLVFVTVTIVVCIIFIHSQSYAHVPYLEEEDFTEEQPFQIKSVEQSIAVYAWLEFENGYTDDIDVYTFKLTEPARVFLESIVPECAEYKDFLPWFALVGPGLPAPMGPVPSTLPPGCGAIIIENYKPGEDRPTFFESFGDKSYYRGPNFDETLKEAGTYYLYYWDPDQRGGDYVAIIGYEESFSAEDILRSLKYTPMIRQNKELHVECK